EGFWNKGRMPSGREWWHRGAFTLWPAASPMTQRLEDWGWLTIDAEHAYEANVTMVRAANITHVPPGTSAIRAAFAVLPPDMPLRQAVPLSLALPAGLSPEHTSIY